MSDIVWGDLFALFLPAVPLLFIGAVLRLVVWFAKRGKANDA